MRVFFLLERLVLNVNTVVEILIAVGETGDWRTSLVNAIPQRKVQHLVEPEGGV